MDLVVNGKMENEKRRNEEGKGRRLRRRGNTYCSGERKESILENRLLETINIWKGGYLQVCLIVEDCSSVHQNFR